MLVSALVFNPVTDEMFMAEHGQGAYLNEKRLRVAARKNLNECVIASGAPFMGKEGHDQFLAELRAVLDATAGMRRFGAASLDLAWVGGGEIRRVLGARAASPGTSRRAFCSCARRAAW